MIVKNRHTKQWLAIMFHGMNSTNLWLFHFVYVAPEHLCQTAFSLLWLREIKRVSLSPYFPRHGGKATTKF